MVTNVATIAIVLVDDPEVVVPDSPRSASTAASPSPKRLVIS
jgi:hypothetical protein